MELVKKLTKSELKVGFLSLSEIDYSEFKKVLREIGNKKKTKYKIEGYIGNEEAKFQLDETIDSGHALPRGRLTGRKIRNYFTNNGFVKGSIIRMKIENNQLIILSLSNENIIEEDTFSINITDDFTFNDNRENDFKKIVKKSENETEIVRKHGKIVKKLKSLLEERGHKVANNNNCDLITYENNIVKSIFEIKTGNDVQSLATSIGQLILYSSAYERIVNLYIVLPMRLSDKILQKLKTNDINVITYNINENTSEISFENLPNRF